MSSGYEDGRIVVDRARGKLHSQGDQATPSARGVIGKVERPRAQCGLAFIDQMHRHPKAAQLLTKVIRIGTGAQRNRLDFVLRNERTSPIKQGLDALDSKVKNRCRVFRKHRKSGFARARINA